MLNGRNFTANQVRREAALSDKLLEEIGISNYRLGQIADTTSGGTPSRHVAAYYGGSIPWVKSGELNDGVITQVEEYITEEGLKNSSAKIFPEGTLVVALYGATVGKTGFLGFDSASNQAVCAIFPKTEKVKVNFLYWFLRYKRPDFLDRSFGGAQPNISQKFLRETKLPLPDINLQEAICNFFETVDQRNQGKAVELAYLPEPLSHIRRLVARIEELAAKVKRAQSLRQKSVVEVEALLAVARNKMFGEKPKRDWVPLNKYVKAIENGKSPACEKRPASIDEWGVLKVGAVSFGYFNPNENKALPITMQPNLDYQVQIGDFLMNRANTLALVGQCAIVEKTPNNLLLSDKIFRFIFREEPPIDRYFFNQVLKSPALREQIEANATGTSPTMKNISKAKVLALKVPAFSLSEQRRIVAYLDSLQTKVEAVKRHQAVTAAELDALLPSILDKAFKGEL